MDWRKSKNVCLEYLAVRTLDEKGTHRSCAWSGLQELKLPLHGRLARR